MRTSAKPVTAAERRVAGRRAAVTGLALLSGGLLVLRFLSAAQRDTVLFRVQVELMAVALLGAALALAAAVTVARSERWTAWLLGAALLMELVLSLMEALVPLVVVPPLVGALGLVLVPILRREGELGVDYSRARAVVAGVSLVLMVLMALPYQALVVLVSEEVMVAGQVSYLVLLAGTVWLVIRRSWWAAAGPVLAVALWFGGLSAGEHFLGWTA